MPKQEINLILAELNKVQQVQALQVQKLDNYIKSDDEWKNSVLPAIQSMQKFQGFSDTGMALLKTIIVIGAVISAIWAGILFIIKQVR